MNFRSIVAVAIFSPYILFEQVNHSHSLFLLFAVTMQLYSCISFHCFKRMCDSSGASCRSTLAKSFNYIYKWNRCEYNVNIMFDAIILTFQIG